MAVRIRRLYVSIVRSEEIILDCTDILRGACVDTLLKVAKESFPKKDRQARGLPPETFARVGNRQELLGKCKLIL